MTTVVDMPDLASYTDRLAALFVERFHVQVPSPDTDLFETAILDSLQLVELLLQLEQQFGFRIAMDDLDLDDLRTLRGIARLVASHSAADAARTRSASLSMAHGAADVRENNLEFRSRSAEPEITEAKVGGNETKRRAWQAPATGRG